MTPFPAARALSRRILPDQPALPQGWQRDPFLHLVERVAPQLGLGRATAHVWTRLAAMTRPGDWTAEDREPFVYAAASELAKILGLSEPRLRCHTAELERAGLIERRTAANGSRSMRSGTGLYFNGAIARFSELLDLDRHLTAMRHRAMHLRGQRSTHRRCLREALEQLHRIAPRHPRVQVIADAFEAWPRSDRLHAMSLEALIAHEAEADALCRSALDLLDNLQESSGQPLETERSHLQDTTQDPLVSCNASVVDQSAGKPAHANSFSPPPDGVGKNAEKQRDGEGGFVNSEFIAKIGPERLFHLASPDMQLYLSGRASPDRLRFHDFIWTAERRLPELGIHPSAWREACAQMGPDRATIAMLILDARRSHPDTPIFSAGGYLRGMIRAFQQGHLNLTGSLIGLTERQRQEPAP